MDRLRIAVYDSYYEEKNWLSAADIIECAKSADEADLQIQAKLVSITSVGFPSSNGKQATLRPMLSRLRKELKIVKTS
jgi:hypothetical protein